MKLTRHEASGVQVFQVYLDAERGDGDLTRLKGLLARQADLRKPAVLDLSLLDFLTSRSLGSLVAASRGFHNAGGQFIIAGLGPRLAETMRIVRLDRILALRLTVNDAVAALTTRPAPTLEMLIAGNPNPEAVRTYWRARNDDVTTPTPEASSALRRTAQRETTRQRESSRPIIPGTNFDPQDLTPMPWAAERLDLLSDWNEGLLLFGKAQALAQRHGVPFRPETTFREFLERLSDALSKSGQ